MERTTKEEDKIQYCRDRLKCYTILEKIHGYARAYRILSLYELN